MSVRQHALNSAVFDYVLVVDRFHLTGEALTELARRRFPGAVCEHVISFSRITEQLMQHAGTRQLIILELITDTDSLADGMKLLAALTSESRNPWCRLMVCTDLAEPLLLRAITRFGPTALALRTDTLSDLQSCMLQSGFGQQDIVLSPRVRALLQEPCPVTLTVREIQWLIHRIDGLDFYHSARAMGVAYKTVTTFSRQVMKRLALSNSMALNRWLAMIESMTGRRDRKK